MRLFQKLPIKWKLMLVIVLASVIAAALLGSALFFTGLVRLRHLAVQETAGLAGIIGRDCAGALAAKDANAAQKKLGDLAARTTLEEACLYTADGREFARYTRRDLTPRPLPPVRGSAECFAGDHLELYRPIEHGGKPVGTIHLRANTHTQWDRIKSFVGVSVVATAILALVVLALASWLERFVFSSMQELVRVARAVTERKDFTLRAAKLSEDETGVLTDAFNEMLGIIQERDSDSRASQSRLEKRVVERTRQLEAANAQLKVEIAERTQAEQEIAQLNAKLEARVQQRTAELSAEIAERKQAEEALRESEERYRAVLEDQTELISRFRADGTFTFVNQVYCRFFGKTREELLGNKWHPQAVAEDLALIEAKLRTLSPSNPVVVIENRVHSGSGEVRWMQFVNRGFFDADGRLVETQAVGRDITERKRAEAALRESEQKYRTLFDSIDEGFCIIEMLFDSQGKPADFRYLEVNQAFEKQTGLRNAAGRRAREIMPTLEAHWLETYGRVAVTGRPERFQNRAEFVGRWFDLFAFRVGEPEQRRVAVLFNDITGRKKLESELALREQRLNAFFKGATAGLVLMDKDLRFIQINDTLAEINGVPAQEHLGRAVREVLPKFAPAVEPIIRKVFATGEPVLNIEVTGETPKQPGVQRHWLESFFPVTGADGQVKSVGAVVVEITEHKRAMESLRVSEERLRLTTTGSNTGLWDWDLRTNEVYYSSIWKQQIGYEDHEISNSFEEWRSRVHPDDLDHAFAKVKAFVQKPWPNFENEFRFRHKDGSYRWMLAKASLQMDADGKPCRMLGSQLDITERKKTEEKLRLNTEQLQTLSRSLVEAQETERRRIAQELHDGIGQTLMLLKLSLDTAANASLEQARERLQDASRRTHELIAAVRNLSLELRPSMLDDVGLLPALLWLGDRFAGQTQVHIEHSGVEGRRFSPEVEIAAYRIAQEALSNVVRHAATAQATVRLQADAQTLQVEVEDAGCGFDATVALAKSSSIGLHGMRERAAALGGELTIASAPGAGTRVMARLPIGKVTGDE